MVVDAAVPMAIDAQPTDKEKDVAPAPVVHSLARILIDDLSLIDRSVDQKDNRLSGRALRTVKEIRKRWTKSTVAADSSADPAEADKIKESVAELVSIILSAQNRSNQSESAYQLHSVNEIQSHNELNTISTQTKEIDHSISKPLTIESMFFLDLLFGLYLLDHSSFEQAASFFSSMLRSLSTINRRSMDLIAAKVYFYYALSHEKANKQSMNAILPSLLSSYRTACLQHNEPGQAVLINAILRVYVLAHQYSLADTFRLKSLYPRDLRLIPSPVYARYCYYVGKIQCIQLAYSDAFASLQQARRKVGTVNTSNGGSGSTQLVRSIDLLLVLTELLMGDIPERSSLNSPALLPYLELTRAVRVGDLHAFQVVSSKYAPVFAEDDVTSLIARLRHTVIKTGLRAINLSYSAIKLDDMTRKLALEQSFADDSEALVAKAIADGVIDATMDFATHSMHSRPVEQVLDTLKPQAAFHRRINLALEIHNDAVKALAFPQTATGANLNAHDLDDDSDDEDSFTAQQRRERLQKEKAEREKAEKEKKDKEGDKKDDKKGQK